jgi:DNA-directed RNA polymerase subunit RPC12/RpoP
MFIIREDNIERLACDKEYTDDVISSRLEECACGSKVFYVEIINKDEKNKESISIELHCAVCGKFIGGWTFKNQDTEEKPNYIS